MATNNPLKDALRGNGGGTPQPLPLGFEGEGGEPDGRTLFSQTVAALEPKDAARLLLGRITGIELEAVIGGALMKLHLASGVSPADVLPALKQIDPGCVVRTEFPRGGFGGGKRETKLARCLVINLDASRDGMTFIDLVCQNGEDMKVGVTKKTAPEFLPKLEALGKVGEKQLIKLQNAASGKKSTTVILHEEEQFGVLCWEMDGKWFMDGLQAEPPAEKHED